MLVELRVRQLGVIDDVVVRLGPGMTVLTGETGAGKTLVVEAIELLLGGRADPVLVRPGAAEATVEGRFDVPAGVAAEAGRPAGVFEPEGPPAWARLAVGGELVLARTIPREGRSRAYAGGQMASLATLGDAGRALVDLHGQHAYQSLLSPAVQRSALDRFGGIDLAPLAAARQRARQVAEAQATLGGDARSRARELDLVRFQLQELEAAGLDDPDEDAALEDEEERLAGAATLRQATLEVHEILSGDGGVLDRLGAAVSALAGRRPVAALHDRLRALEVELDDAASDSRALGEQLEDDPERLSQVVARRQLLTELRRKYGDSLSEVLVFRDDARRRLEELESFEERAGALDREAEVAQAEVSRAEEHLGAARRAAAPGFAAAVEAELRALALPRARFEVAVDDDRAGEAVAWLLAANPGEPLLPLTKVASGGELARTMLAARLVLSGAGGGAAPGAGGGRQPGAGAPPEPGPSRTLVFDEVDAGVGGEAAVAVGRALALLAEHHQVLVVTHLPQVAAFADHHLAVTKEAVGERTVSRVVPLEGDERVVELSRMLSGRPRSETARRHAEELLASARASLPATAAGG